MSNTTLTSTPNTLSCRSTKPRGEMRLMWPLLWFIPTSPFSCCFLLLFHCPPSCHSFCLLTPISPPQSTPHPPLSLLTSLFHYTVASLPLQLMVQCSEGLGLRSLSLWFPSTDNQTTKRRAHIQWIWCTVHRACMSNCTHATYFTLNWTVYTYSTLEVCSFCRVHCMNLSLDTCSVDDQSSGHSVHWHSFINIMLCVCVCVCMHVHVQRLKPQTTESSCQQQ